MSAIIPWVSNRCRRSVIVEIQTSPDLPFTMTSVPPPSGPVVDIDTSSITEDLCYEFYSFFLQKEDSQAHYLGPTGIP